jgi:hypothetical protein
LPDSLRNLTSLLELQVLGSLSSAMSVALLIRHSVAAAGFKLFLHAFLKC